MGMNADGTFDFSIGDNDKAAKVQTTRFKQELNQLDRLSFAWWPLNDDGTVNFDAPSPKFRGAPRHYVKGKGYFLNQGRPEVEAILGVPIQTRMCAIVVRWPTNKKAEPDSAALLDGDSEVNFWVFDPKKYEDFYPLNEDNPFGSYDLIVKCTQADYQHQTFRTKKGNLLREISKKPEMKGLYDDIMEMVAARALAVNAELGQTKTLDELRAIMAGGGGTTPAKAVASGDVDDEIEAALNI